MIIPIIELHGYEGLPHSSILKVFQNANLIYNVDEDMTERGICDIVKNRYGRTGVHSFGQLDNYKKLALQSLQ